MKRGLWLLLAWPLCAQEAARDVDAELKQAVANVNAVFEQAWPGAVEMMKRQLAQQMGDMGGDDMVRKLRVAELNLDKPPRMTFTPCADGEDCRRVRFAAPGAGKWSIKVAGEIVPPWQRNRDRWRKLRLTLKDLSLTQDYRVVAEPGGALRLEPAGPPEMTYRLTSPNLLYRAMLAAAQRFIGDSLKESLAEDMLSELPIAELALVHLGGLDMKNAVADLGERLSAEPDSASGDAAVAEALGGPRWLSLDERVDRESDLPPMSVEAGAFEVAFVEKDLDFYAPTFTAEAAVEIPAGARIEDVTFRLGDREIARLTEPPWRVEVAPGDDAQVLFATATLTDGVQEDDFLYIEGRGHIEEMAVRYVKTPVSFPPDTLSEQELLALTPADFRVFEDGKPQTIENLSLALNRRLELTLAIDMSYSMEGRRLERARIAAAQFVGNLFRPGDRVRILAYNDRVQLSSPLTELEQIERAINGLRKVRGGTRTLDALDRALDARTDEDALHVTVLITDGWDAGGNVSMRTLKQRLEQADTLVYIVGIDVRKDYHAGYGEGFTPLARPNLVHLRDLYDLSMITGGRPFFVDRPAWLNRAFSELEEELRSQLVIGYVSNQSRRGRGWRKIEVKCLANDAPLAHKERYWQE